MKLFDKFIMYFCVSPRPMTVRVLDAIITTIVLLFWLFVFPPVLFLLLHPGCPMRQQFSKKYWLS